MSTDGFVLALAFVHVEAVGQRPALLGYRKVARLLQQTLTEEGSTDKKLTELAESIINVEAVGA